MLMKNNEILEQCDYLSRSIEENRSVYYLSMGKYSKEDIIKNLIRFCRETLGDKSESNRKVQEIDK